jgi:aryl-alcohol dehydrogenase-like predicted oxidoreductase
VLLEVAKARGATPHQIALAFLLRHPSVFTIPKAARMAHVDELVGAWDVVLTSDDVQKLESAFPRTGSGSLKMI